MGVGGEGSSLGGLISCSIFVGGIAPSSFIGGSLSPFPQADKKAAGKNNTLDKIIAKIDFFFFINTPFSHLHSLFCFTGNGNAKFLHEQYKGEKKGGASVAGGLKNAKKGKGRGIRNILGGARAERTAFSQKLAKLTKFFTACACVKRETVV